MLAPLPRVGCSSVPPWCPHLSHFAARSSRSLGASGPHRIVKGTNATGASCMQLLLGQTTHHHVDRVCSVSRVVIRPTQQRRSSEGVSLNRSAAGAAVHSCDHQNVPSFTRSIAGLFGFLILSQLFDGPLRYGMSRRFDTMPSSPSLQACRNISLPSPSKCAL
jgi:hypothetical protein